MRASRAGTLSRNREPEALSDVVVRDYDPYGQTVTGYRLGRISNRGQDRGVASWTGNSWIMILGEEFMPREQPRRDLGDLVDKVKTSSGPHLPPARAHFRSARDKYREETPPEAPFSRKLSAFLQTRVFDWVVNYLKFRFGPKHAFQTYAGTKENGIYPLAGDSHFRSTAAPDEPVRVSVAGDWATGTEESEQIAERIRDFLPHYTLHIGDVYYAGDKDEVETNCLGQAPRGSNRRGVEFPPGSIGSFAMNGNHEMYANGNGYFDVFLPVLGMRRSPGGKPAGQKASYFCLRYRLQFRGPADSGEAALVPAQLQIARCDRTVVAR